MRISKTDVEYLLTTSPVARLATINIDGSPHQVPIVFTWHGGCFWSPIDGKPKQQVQLRRVKNVMANPCGSLLVDEYHEDWTQLWWIRADLEITVLQLEDTNPKVREIVMLAKTKLEKKYAQYDRTVVLRDPATILLMRPTGFTSWRAGNFSISQRELF